MNEKIEEFKIDLTPEQIIEIMKPLFNSGYYDYDYIKEIFIVTPMEDYNE